MSDVGLHLSLDTLVIVFCGLISAIYYFNRRDGNDALTLSQENSRKIERIIGALQQKGFRIDI